MQMNRRQFSKAALLAGAIAPQLAASLLAEETGMATYTVQQGDTLSALALRFGTSTAELRRINQLSGDLIRAGQILKFPNSGATPPTSEGSIQYVVATGDTLGGIALRYGVTVQAIKTRNALTTDVIRIGQVLQIPASTAAREDYLSLVRSETATIQVRRDNWARIVVHHSGIKYGNVKKYDAAHRRRGMQNGMAYHFLIGNGIDSGDGEIEIGPRWTKQLLGGHVKNYRINLTAIGICLVGNFETDHPSRRQMEAFTQLMDWLRGEIVPNARKFAGHRELRGEQTICPGKNFPLAAMHRRYDG